ncbi:MAG: 50S ribosomal protein L21e [Nanohaloarchaea archaeon]|nr:50S ribosomal protein L21e [Candidatus Nanohaloarchaea archaeon]
MAQKSHGSQQGARKTLSKDSDHTTTINDRLKTFEEGEKALIQINPSVTEGRVHTRYHGKTVEVTGERGDAYQVEFEDGGKTKILYIQPVHLEKLE